MNKKILVLLSVCACIQLYGGTAAMRGDSNPIVLKGELITDTSGAKSGAPVAASLDEGVVVVQFNQTLGSLNVKVVDDQGSTMYQKNVKANAGSSVTIDTETWDNGEYTLTITDDEGGCLEGVFELDR